MTEIWPVLIASKGRPDGRTFSLLRESQIKYSVFVESEDEAKYESALGLYCDKVFVLPKSNQGIGYVRQTILDYARQKNIEWYWMMDDDISGFYKTQTQRTIKITAREALETCQRQLLQLPTVAQAALEYQQFAWSATVPLKMNSYCDVCVAINPKRVGRVNYRPELRLKEDRDFTLQLIANSGYQTCRFSFYSFSVPKNGSNKGGCQDDYKTKDRELEHSKKMCELWPGICTLNFKRDGRPDVKINWGLFKPIPPKP